MPSSSYPSSLLKLPRELRDEIYFFVFAHTAEEDIYSISEKWHPVLAFKAHSSTIPNEQIPIPPYASLPAISKTCRQLYWETVPVFMKWCPAISLENERCTRRCLKWLTTFNNSKMYHGIRRLKFQDVSMELEGRGSMESLLRLCQNLVYLEVLFPIAAINQLHRDPHLSPPGGRLYDKFNLSVTNPLFSTFDIPPKLQGFSFGFHDRKNVVDDSVFMQRIIFDFQSLLIAKWHDRYREEGRKSKRVEVECVHRDSAMLGRTMRRVISSDMSRVISPEMVRRFAELGRGGC